jgi:hypothetical protein
VDCYLKQIIGSQLVGVLEKNLDRIAALPTIVVLNQDDGLLHQTTELLRVLLRLTRSHSVCSPQVLTSLLQKSTLAPPAIRTSILHLLQHQLPRLQPSEFAPDFASGLLASMAALTLPSLLLNHPTPTTGGIAPSAVTTVTSSSSLSTETKTDSGDTTALSPSQHSSSGSAPTSPVVSVDHDPKRLIATSIGYQSWRDLSHAESSQPLLAQFSFLIRRLLKRVSWRRVLAPLLIAEVMRTSNMAQLLASGIRLELVAGSLCSLSAVLAILGGIPEQWRLGANVEIRLHADSLLRGTIQRVEPQLSIAIVMLPSPFSAPIMAAFPLRVLRPVEKIPPPDLRLLGRTHARAMWNVLAECLIYHPLLSEQKSMSLLHSSSTKLATPLGAAYKRDRFPSELTALLSLQFMNMVLAVVQAQQTPHSPSKSKAAVPSTTTTSSYGHIPTFELEPSVDLMSPSSKSMDKDENENIDIDAGIFLPSLLNISKQATNLPVTLQSEPEMETYSHTLCHRLAQVSVAEPRATLSPYRDRTRPTPALFSSTPGSGEFKAGESIPHTSNEFSEIVEEWRLHDNTPEPAEEEPQYPANANATAAAGSNQPSQQSQQIATTANGSGGPGGLGGLLGLPHNASTHAQLLQALGGGALQPFNVQPLPNGQGMMVSLGIGGTNGASAAMAAAQAASAATTGSGSTGAPTATGGSSTTGQEIHLRQLQSLIEMGIPPHVAQMALASARRAGGGPSATGSNARPGDLQNAIELIFSNDMNEMDEQTSIALMESLAATPGAIQSVTSVTAPNGEIEQEITLQMDESQLASMLQGRSNAAARAATAVATSSSSGTTSSSGSSSSPPMTSLFGLPSSLFPPSATTNASSSSFMWPSVGGQGSVQTSSSSSSSSSSVQSSTAATSGNTSVGSWTGANIAAPAGVRSPVLLPSGGNVGSSNNNNNPNTSNVGDASRNFSDAMQRFANTLGLGQLRPGLIGPGIGPSAQQQSSLPLNMEPLYLRNRAHPSAPLKWYRVHNSFERSRLLLRIRDAVNAQPHSVLELRDFDFVDAKDSYNEWYLGQIVRSKRKLITLIHYSLLWLDFHRIIFWAWF